MTNNINHIKALKDSIICQINVEAIFNKNLDFVFNKDYIENNLTKFLIHCHHDENEGKYLFFNFAKATIRNHDIFHNFVNDCKNQSFFSQLVLNRINKFHNYVYAHYLDDYRNIVELIDDDHMEMSNFYVFDMDKKQLFEV